MSHDTTTRDSWQECEVAIRRELEAATMGEKE